VFRRRLFNKSLHYHVYHLCSASLWTVFVRSRHYVEGCLISH
jgi:hypothetical protein